MLERARRKQHLGIALGVRLEWFVRRSGAERESVCPCGSPTSRYPAFHDVTAEQHCGIRRGGGNQVLTLECSRISSVKTEAQQLGRLSLFCRTQ